MSLYEQIIADLVKQGYGFMPINVDLFESADSAARIFLRAQSSNWQDWCFRRNDGTDLGIVEEAEDSADCHLALSFAHDLSRRKSADDAHTRACLGAITNFYNHLKREVSLLVSILERECETSEVPARICSTFHTGDERATSLLLRSSMCGRQALANSLQAESVLSFYVASEDNEIWLKNEVTGKWELRSPPYGSALVFFGLKAGEFGNPAFKPKAYKIEANSGKLIRATIMHVEMKEVEVVELPPEVSNVVTLS